MSSENYSGWKLLPEDDCPKGLYNGGDRVHDTVDGQDLERKRRLASGSKTKTHRRYIQDIVLFLKDEARYTELDIQFEHKEVNREHFVKVTVSDVVHEGRGKTLKTAKEAAAKAMIKEIGPYIEDETWLNCANEIVQSTPFLFKQWLPPIFDVRHISMLNSGGVPFKGESGSPAYEVEMMLGPLTGVSISDNIQTSLSSLVRHLSNFLVNRDLKTITREPLDETLKEMDVFKHLNQPYVQSPGIVEVRLEGPKQGSTGGKLELVLPPVDVFTMQQHLPKGLFPPYYGSRDQWGCMKVFYCHRCMVKMNGTDTLIKHVKGIKHWRKIGKIFVSGQLRETFSPVSEPVNPRPVDWVSQETEEEKKVREGCTPKLCQNCLEEGKREIAAGHCTSCNEELCGACCEAHGRTRVTKGHKIDLLEPPTIKHPKHDEENGVKVERDNLKYIIAVYRCTTNKIGSSQRAKDQNDRTPSPGVGKPFAPPVNTGAVSGNGQFGAMYNVQEGGSDAKQARLGWEDPNAGAGTGPSYGINQNGGGNGMFNSNPNGGGNGMFNSNQNGGGNGMFNHNPNSSGNGMFNPNGGGNGMFNPNGGGNGMFNPMMEQQYGGMMGDQGMYGGPMGRGMIGPGGWRGGDWGRPTGRGGGFGPMGPSGRGYGRGYNRGSVPGRGGNGGSVRGQPNRHSNKNYSGGEIVKPNNQEDSTNEAYSGMVGKTGPSSKKTAPRFAALPPPGHNQWNNIRGNENGTPVRGVDKSVAHIPGVGQNFKANRTGLKVCISWKRGNCAHGDRCIYNHCEPGQTGKNRLQAAVDANISPLEKDLVGYRIASDRIEGGGTGVTDPSGGEGFISGPDGKMKWQETGDKIQLDKNPDITRLKQHVQVLGIPPPEKSRKLESDTTDWYNSGSSGLDLKSTDRDAIMKSIQEAKKVMPDCETDFTKVPKRRSKWD